MNAHSGYNCCVSKGDPGNGDMIDWHVYTGPDAPRPSATRFSVLGEFGGIGLRTPGHEYSPDGRFFAYEQVFSNAQLNDRYTGMVRDVQRLMTTKGVSAYVYTEITDVEGEYNGLLTYDRRVQKVDTGQLRAAHGALIDASRNLNATPNHTLGHVRSFRVTTPRVHRPLSAPRRLGGPHRRPVHRLPRSRPPGRLVPHRGRTRRPALPLLRVDPPAGLLPAPLRLRGLHRLR